MIHLLLKIPKSVTVAFSGGVDSVAAVDFLSRNHEVDCAFFHHGTPNSDKAESFVSKFCYNRGLKLHVGRIKGNVPKGFSLEEFWRDSRYEFLSRFEKVITAHHLNDAVETWVWSSLHGNPRLPLIINKKIMRPFLATPKKELVLWNIKNGLGWCEDESNKDNRFTRNYIRNVMMENVLRVNKGIEKTVKKLVLIRLGLS